MVINIIGVHPGEKEAQGRPYCSPPARRLWQESVPSLKADSNRTRGKVMPGKVQGGYYSKNSYALEETAQEVAQSLSLEDVPKNNECKFCLW